MLTGHIRRPDGSFDTTSSLIEASKILRDEPGTHLWLDLQAPDEWTLMLLGEAFNFHPLAIEDCLHGEQRPRIDPYENHIFMVVYGPLLSDEDEFMGARELAIFCSTQYIVTIHHEPLRTLNTLKERCCRDPENVLGRGMDHLLHAIVDGAIDAYQPILDRLEQETMQMEDTALTDPRPDVLATISDTRSDILQIRRYLMPLRESIGQLARGEYAFIGKNIRPYFRDVLDHLVRTIELLDLYREMVLSAQNMYMSALTQRTNEIIKTLTIWATVALPPVVVASIYGMNYPLWPPQEHPWSFWGILGFMVALMGGLFYWFRRANWL